MNSSVDKTIKKGSSRPWEFNCFQKIFCYQCKKTSVRILFTARPKRETKNLLCWECSYQFRKYCGHCKNEFSPVSLKGNGFAYCVPCRRKLQLIQKQAKSISSLYESKNCEWCYQEFLPKTFKSKCCSRKCTLAYNDFQRSFKQNRVCDLIVCSCGKLIGKRFHKCSDCSSKYRKEKHSKAEARRADVYAAGDRGITWRSVGARDNWVCHLCQGKVERKAGTAYVPDGATVDHVVAIAKGGSHTWDNVALAHRRCNTSRGARDLDLVNGDEY